MARSGRKVQPITSYPHFFKVILPAALADGKLGIPERFVKKFGDELSANATLKVPNGRIWTIGLEKEGRKICFQNGWEDFIEHHSICAGYFLVFKYAKNSTFEVLIFDKTACEICYPYNGKKSANDEQDLLDNEMGNEAVSIEENSDFKQGSQPQSKKSKMEDLEEMNVSNDDDEDNFLALLNEMGIFFTRKYRSLSKEGRERAINIARSFRPKIPSFMVILQSYHIYASHLSVPVQFADKYVSRNAQVVTLQLSDGREWCVNIREVPGSGVRLTIGWTKFLKDNNLKEGDICFFELIRMKDIVMKVSVFDGL